MKKIVLIDDDVFIRDLVATKLSSENYNVIAVGNSGEGMKLVKEEQPDLLLLDLDLPDIHGLEVLKRLKADDTTAAIPVIIFSNNDELRDDVLAAGATDFFLKVSLDMNELANELSKYLS